MRCPDCNKFVSYDELEPESRGIEVDSFEIGDDGALWADITDEIRVCLACAECGTELKEATFDLQRTVRIESAQVRNIPEGDLEVIARWDVGPNFDSKSEGKGRGAKTFYGYDGIVEILYGHKAAPSKIIHFLPVADQEQASSFEELV